MERQLFMRLAYLELGMLSPIVIMLISLISFDMFTLSALLYNGLSLSAMPLIYMKYICPQRKIGIRRAAKHYLKNRLQDMKKQLIIGLCLLMGIYLVIVINYDICENYFRKEIIDKIVIDFNKNPWNFCLLVGIFGLANPWLEEFFWRNFIPQAIFDLLQHYSNRSNYSQGNQQQQGEVDEEADHVRKNILSTVSEVNEDLESQFVFSQNTHRKLNESFYQIIFTLHFASYHFFVVLHISNILFASLATVAVALAGRLFLFLNYRFGYVTNALAHMGADLGFCTIALVLFYHNKVLF